MEEELVIRGTLEETSLPALLCSVYRNKESGVLTCAVHEHRKTIFFREGQIIFASSTDPDERLGQSLLRHGKITIRDFLIGTQNVRPDRRFGAILCENHAIAPEDLVEGVRRQVRDIVIGMFDLTRGPYELALRAVESQEMILLTEPAEDLIYQGVKSIRSWARISQGIGTVAHLLRPTSDSEKILLNLNLVSEELHLVSLCSTGRFNVEEICGMSYLTNYETCRILWALLLIGVLESVESGDRPMESSISYASSMNAESDLHDLVEKYNDLFSHIHESVAGRMSEGVQELEERAIQQVQGTMPHVTRDLHLDHYGRVDFDVILRNLYPVPENGRMALVAGALEEIVYALLYEVGNCLGPKDQTKIAEEVQDLRKH